jgi:hypothetical protein
MSLKKLSFGPRRGSEMIDAWRYVLFEGDDGTRSSIARRISADEEQVGFCPMDRVRQAAYSPDSRRWHHGDTE